MINAVKKYLETKGQLFSDRDPKKIETFLREYHDKPKIEIGYGYGAL